MPFRPIQPGDLAAPTQFAVDTINRALREIERLANLTVAPPLELSESPAGFVLGSKIIGPSTGKITSIGAWGITQLASAISSTSATTISVDSGSDFPADYTYHVRIDDEILKVTAGFGTSSWTVERGVMGTTAATHLIDSNVVQLGRVYGWTEDRESAGGGWETKVGGLVALQNSGSAWERNWNLSLRVGERILVWPGALQNGRREYICERCCNTITAKITEIGLRAKTTLASPGCTDVATSINVASASGFPLTAPFRICIDGEHLLVTAGAGTTTWTVERGVDDTTAAAHAIDDIVDQVSLAYGWVQTEDAEANGWVQGGNLLMGTPTVCPAFERNDNVDVRVGTQVLLHLGNDNPRSPLVWTFDHCCETIHARIDAVTGGGFTLLNEAGGIDDEVTSFDVDAHSTFPQEVKFRIKIDDEVMVVTGGMGTTAWTVVRGAHGTTAASHADNSRITMFGAICDWTEMEESSNGVGDWQVRPGGWTGTKEFRPLYERNGHNAIPLGIVVPIFRGYLNENCSQEWVFDYRVEPKEWSAEFGVTPSLEACLTERRSRESWCAEFSVAPVLESCPRSPNPQHGERWCAEFSVAPVLESCLADTAPVDASRITTGTIDPERLGSGTPGSGNFLRGDSSWQSITTGVSKLSAAGATTNSYEIIGLVTNASGVPTWGTIKNTHASFSMDLELNLEDAFSGTDSQTITVGPLSSFSFHSLTTMGSPPSTTALPPYTYVRFRVKSTVSGDHADYEIEQSYF